MLHCFLKKIRFRIKQKRAKIKRRSKWEIFENMIHPNTQSLRPESPISGFSAKKFESVSVERILSTQMYCMRWWWKMMQFSSSKNRFLPVFVLFYIEYFLKQCTDHLIDWLKYKYFFDKNPLCFKYYKKYVLVLCLIASCYLICLV